MTFHCCHHSVVGGELGDTLWIFVLFWTILSFTMAPNLKTRMKPPKKGLTTKIRKRAQLPRDPLSSEDECVPILRDVMKAPGTLTTCRTTTEEKISAFSRPTLETPPLTEQATRFTLPPQSEDIQPRDTHPSADFGGLLVIDEEMRAGLTERHRGPSTGYFPTTDEDSGQDEPPPVPGQRKGKGVSEKLRTADTTIYS